MPETNSRGRTDVPPGDEMEMNLFGEQNPGTIGIIPSLANAPKSAAMDEAKKGADRLLRDRGSVT